MKILINTLLATVIALFPVYALGQDKDPSEFELVPKVEWEREGDRACMSFGETKKLAKMRSQYVTLYNLVPQMELELTYWKKAASEKERAANAALDAQEETQESYERLEVDFDQVVEEKHRAKASSVFGGAFPWVVGALGVSFVGGVWTGIKLSGD